MKYKNQLDATSCFIILIICSTCFRHFYAHRQELTTVVLITTWPIRFCRDAWGGVSVSYGICGACLVCEVLPIFCRVVIANNKFILFQFNSHNFHVCSSGGVGECNRVCRVSLRQQTCESTYFWYVKWRCDEEMYIPWVVVGWKLGARWLDKCPGCRLVLSCGVWGVNVRLK